MNVSDAGQQQAAAASVVTDCSGSADGAAARESVPPSSLPADPTLLMSAPAAAGTDPVAGAPAT